MYTIFSVVAKEGLAEKVTSGKRPDEGEERSYAIAKKEDFQTENHEIKP